MTRGVWGGPGPDPRSTMRTPEWRKWRARKAALAMHAQGKTNTEAATRAHLERFATPEELSEYMRSVARHRGKKA
jgi:hypothetical protein